MNATNDKLALLPVQTLSATYITGRLTISAEGRVNGGLTDARVVRSPAQIEPPIYQVVGRIDDKQPINEPYHASGSFASPVVYEVPVQTADGTQKVKVVIVPAAEEKNDMAVSGVVTGYASNDSNIEEALSNAVHQIYAITGGGFHAQVTALRLGSGPAPADLVLGVSMSWQLANSDAKPAALASPISGKVSATSANQVALGADLSACLAQLRALEKPFRATGDALTFFAVGAPIGFAGLTLSMSYTTIAMGPGPVLGAGQFLGSAKGTDIQGAIAQVAAAMRAKGVLAASSSVGNVRLDEGSISVLFSSKG